MASTSAPPAGTAHYGLPGHEVVLLLEADPLRGLTATEAAARLVRFGSNLLPHAETAGAL